MNPELALTLRRVIRAPRDVVWNASTDSSLLERWWTPAPTPTRVDRLDVRPGGGFVTRMSDDGGGRLVFTNAIDSSWHPPAPVSMTAEIIFGDHAEGTDYQAIVRHADPDARRRHEELGFFDGWGSVTAALAALPEGRSAH